MTFPGESLLIRLWETLAEKGIGGLLKPWQIKREGLAQLEVRRAALVALASAQRDADDIRAGRKRLEDVTIKYLLPAPADGPSQPSNDPRTLLEARNTIEVSTRGLLSAAIRREVNVAKAVAHAELELKDDSQQPPERNIEEDWLFRWRDYAGDVSSDQLQSLWGKLLAGELKSPGSYSLWAMEFLRNLSTNEAKEIARLSRFVLSTELNTLSLVGSNVIVRSQRKILEAEGLSFGFLLKMQDLGIIAAVQAEALTVNYLSNESNRFIRAFHSHGKALIATHDDPGKMLALEVFTLTDVGRQILRLGRFEPHEMYLTQVRESIRMQGFAVGLANYLNVSDSRMEIFGEEPRNA